MTREMQDGIRTDAAGMDHATDLVAYYIDGPFAWTRAETGLFPRSVHVRIATRWTTRDGHVIDRENGDATPAQAAAWAHQRRADGYPWPTVYCSQSNQAGVIAAFHAAGEPEPLWWLAHYDNLDALPSGVVAKQYADPGPLDKSIVADHWPGVDGGFMLDSNSQPDATVIAGAQSCLAGVTGQHPAGDLYLLCDQTQQVVAQVQQQVAALAGALSTDEAALLAAIRAVPAGQPPTDAQVQTIESAIIKAFPGYTATITPTPSS